MNRADTLRRKQHWFWVAFISLTGLALLLRLYHLGTFPAGLFWDESIEGLDAYSLFGKSFWRWPLFFPAINGREPLFVYLVHIAQQLWGPSVWSVRVVSATAGALLTPALIWLGWEMAPSLGVDQRKQFSLWCGLVALTLLWTQTISRLGQRMSLFVLLEILFFAALWRAWHRQSRPWWVIAGIFAGLSFYTYLAVRVIPLLLALMLGYALLLRRTELRSRGKGLAIGLGAALIIAAPLLVHFVRQPGDFSSRTSQIDIISHGGLPALIENTGRVLGMAFVKGDFNDRLNYPGRPVMDALILVPFLAGLYQTLRHVARPAHFFLVAGLGCLLLPSFLSGEAPNFGRAAGALPVFAVLIAIGLDQLLAWFRRRRPSFHTAAGAVGWAVLLLSVTITAFAYFVQYRHYPRLADAWETGYIEVAYDILAAQPARIYVQAPIMLDHPTLPYILSGQLTERPHPVITGNKCVRITVDMPFRYYFRADADRREVDLLRSYLPDSRARAIVEGFADKPWVMIIEQPTSGRVQFPELQTLSQTFQDGIELMGYSLSQPTLDGRPRVLDVRLFWRVTARPTQSYTGFVHLNRHGQVAAGQDDRPGHGTCKTSDWEPGEVIVNDMHLVLPTDLPEGAYNMAVGLYRLETMQRLKAAGTTDDQVSLGTLEVDQSSTRWLGR